VPSPITFVEKKFTHLTHCCFVTSTLGLCVFLRLLSLVALLRSSTGDPHGQTLMLRPETLQKHLESDVAINAGEIVIQLEPERAKVTVHSPKYEESGPSATEPQTVRREAN
jgi:hypothetical protein